MEKISINVLLVQPILKKLMELVALKFALIVAVNKIIILLNVFKVVQTIVKLVNLIVIFYAKLALLINLFHMKVNVFLYALMVILQIN